MARTIATCHCGAVRTELAAPPAEITECNCSLCSRYGVLWTYYEAADVEVTVSGTETDSYAWNGRNVDFHRCGNCGCVTHWVPRKASRTRRGINSRLLPPDVQSAARLRHRDGAASGK